MRVFLARAAAIGIFVGGFVFDANFLAPIVLPLATDPPPEAPEAERDLTIAFELPDWADPPTGQIPRVLLEDPDSIDINEPLLRKPTWRGEGEQWNEEEFDLSMLAPEADAPVTGEIAGTVLPGETPFGFAALDEGSALELAPDAPDDVEWNQWGPAVLVRVDHAPVALFARAVKDTSAVYRSERAAREAGFEHVPVPPTFTFVMSDSGAYPDLQPRGSSGSMYAASGHDAGRVFARDGLYLHGEQHFTYHRQVSVGDVLEGRMRTSQPVARTARS